MGGKRGAGDTALKRAASSGGREGVPCTSTCPHLSHHAGSAGGAGWLGSICILCTAGDATEQLQRRCSGGSTRRRHLQGSRNCKGSAATLPAVSSHALGARRRGWERARVQFDLLPGLFALPTHLRRVLHRPGLCACTSPLAQGQSPPSQHYAAHSLVSEQVGPSAQTPCPVAARWLSNCCNHSGGPQYVIRRLLGRRQGAGACSKRQPLTSLLSVCS